MNVDNWHYPLKQMEIPALLSECFRYFVHADQSNAAMHCARVRYSPITFRLAEHLAEIFPVNRPPELQRVLDDLGTYPEDPGR